MTESNDRPIETPSAEPFAADTEATSAPVDADELRERVEAVLRTVYDPEIPVNIHELGMIYAVEVGADFSVDVRMTLTSPACPVAGTLPGEVQRKVASVDGVSEARVALVWEPPWTPDMMSEAARLRLNIN